MTWVNYSLSVAGRLIVNETTATNVNFAEMIGINCQMRWRYQSVWADDKLPVNLQCMDFVRITFLINGFGFQLNFDCVQPSKSYVYSRLQAYN